jgi:hypothetical protein
MPPAKNKDSKIGNRRVALSKHRPFDDEGVVFTVAEQGYERSHTVSGLLADDIADERD